MIKSSTADYKFKAWTRQRTKLTKLSNKKSPKLMAKQPSNATNAESCSAKVNSYITQVGLPNATKASIFKPRPCMRLRSLIKIPCRKTGPNKKYIHLIFSSCQKSKSIKHCTSVTLSSSTAYLRTPSSCTLFWNCAKTR